MKQTVGLRKSLSESSNLNQALLNAGNVGPARKECRKCEEIIRSELLDNITPENALVCKHDSSVNLSIQNPGLLIVDQETAFDAHAALLNSQMLPHSHMHQSHQQYQSKKTPKGVKKSSANSGNGFGSSGDYIQMQNLTKTNSNPKMSNQFGTRGGYLDEPHSIPIRFEQEDDSDYVVTNRGKQQQQQQDVNSYDKFLSKSNIFKTRFTDS